ncbi:acyltransferase domain-containing protein [Streptomyces sp. NPDC097107]|uniref:acyltransferase domain-containing protein n=1 Tax=Streptomyces sp. NPDC097107 TaxID=3366089 RepID=UPI00380E5F72
MTSRTAFLFPGQGAYVPGILGEWAEHFPTAARTLQTVDEIAAEHGLEPVTPLLLERGSPSLDELLSQRSDVVDLAIYATDAVAFELLSELGVRADVLVGHSFGEFAALSAAGAVSVVDVARLACLRIEAPRRVDPPEGGLVALSVSAGRAGHLVALLDEPHLCVAIDNGPDQSVLSGPASCLADVEKLAASLDIRATRLRARYAFHNPLMYEAADLFTRTASDVPLHEPRIPVFSPTLGRFVRSVTDVREVIHRNLVTPVHFYDALLTLFREGTRVFVETGARSALTKIVRASLPSAVSAVPLLPSRGRPLELLKELDAAGVPFAWPRDDDPATAPTTPARETVRPDPRTAAGPPDRSVLMAELVGMYAEELGFPEEMLTPDIDLEADLGVDSVKQIALFERVRRQYGLPELPSQRRIQATTLEELAGLVEELRP